jgi:hypothetical protein
VAAGEPGLDADAQVLAVTGADRRAGWQAAEPSIPTHQKWIADDTPSCNFTTNGPYLLSHDLISVLGPGTPLHASYGAPQG